MDSSACARQLADVNVFRRLVRSVTFITDPFWHFLEHDKAPFERSLRSFALPSTDRVIAIAHGVLGVHDLFLKLADCFTLYAVFNET